MPIYLGSNKSKVYLGSTRIKEGYLGSTQVWKSQFIILGTGSEVSGSFAGTTSVGYAWRGNTAPAFTATTTAGISRFRVYYAYPSGYGAGNIYLNTSVSLTGYSTCTFKFDNAVNYTDWAFQIGFVSSIPTDTTYGGTGWTAYGNNAEMITCAKAYVIDGTALSRGTYSFDISSLSGNYYLTVGLIQKGNSGSKLIKISSVILS